MALCCRKTINAAACALLALAPLQVSLGQGAGSQPAEVAEDGSAKPSVDMPIILAPPQPTPLGQGPIDGVSRVLPPGAVRISSPFCISRASGGFLKDGGRASFGLESESLVVEPSVSVGIRDHLGLRVSLPYSLRSLISLDGDRYRQGAAFANSVAELSNRVALKLQEAGLCTSNAACVALIASGFSPPTEISTDIGAGEVLSIKPGVPIEEALEATAIGEVRPPEGWRGPGDLEVALTYEWVRYAPLREVELNAGPGLVPSPFGLSITLFGTAPTARPLPWSRIEDNPGGGNIDAGISLAANFELERHTSLGVSYSVVSEVKEGRRKQPSRLDGRRTLSLPSVRYSKDGIGQRAAVDMSYFMEGVAPVLRPFALGFGYAVDMRRSEVLGQQQVRSGASLHTATGSARFAPPSSELSFEVEGRFDYPLFGSGEIVFLAPWSATLGLTLSTSGGF